MEDNYEKIDNFSKLIEDYYKQKGRDVIFHFLHVIVNYPYIDFHSEYIDGNDNWKLKERVERKKEKQRIYVPVIMNKEYYKENFKGKIYDYNMNPIEIKDSIDIGNTDEFNYDEFYQKVYSNVPKECTVIKDDELKSIANLNGYDKFAWKIYDSSVGLPAIAYGGPNWHYEIYGVKQDRKTIK